MSLDNFCSLFTIGAAATYCEPAYGGRDLSPVITSPLGGLTRRKYKHWTLEPKGVKSVFSYQNLALTVARGCLINISPVMDGWFREVIEQERRAEERNQPAPELPPLPDLGAAKTAAYNGVIRDLNVQILRRWLEEECFAGLGARAAWKLLKDVKESAVRKARRGLPFLELSSRVFTTALRANALGYVAEAAVSQVVLLFRCWRARQRGAPKEAELSWLGRQTVLNLAGVSLRCVGSCALIGACANAEPRICDGIVVGDLVIGTGLVLLLAPWADR
uniref:Uncharacterized protein n=1 Tax=Tetraselmis sp. GSL018 TaxID=582737 RepID=A0A061R7D1_9CHLO